MFSVNERAISIHAPTWGATLDRTGARDVGCISIHAPTWGATERRCPDNQRGKISIHAPTWGATSSAPLRFPAMLFQSTHPRGVRRRGRQYGEQVFGISIHAPTWGATWYLRQCSQRPQHFNPRTHVGCDPFRVLTRPKPRYFNPRTHVGCDRI